MKLLDKLISINFNPELSSKLHALDGMQETHLEWVLKIWLPKVKDKLPILIPLVNDSSKQDILKNFQKVISHSSFDHKLASLYPHHQRLGLATSHTDA